MAGWSLRLPAYCQLPVGSMPESMRVTVKFSGALPAEQIISQAPLPDQFDGQSLDWDVTGQKAGEDVWLAFMAPDWWAGFAKARSVARRRARARRSTSP